MHEIDALAQNFNHTTVYAQLNITCNGPKIRMCANTDNTAMTTHLMVISYVKCLTQCTKMLRLWFGAVTHTFIVKCSHCIVLSILQHVTHFKLLYSVCSVKSKTKANMSRKHWLTY